MTERLRKILKGGKITPKTADETAVKYAVDNAGGGGSELPDVTADDNGKVLTVIDGEWKEAPPQPVNDDFLVEITMETVDDTPVFSADKRVNEILAAKTSGQHIVAIYDNGQYVTEAPLTAYGTNIAGFGCLTPNQDSSSATTIAILGVSGGETEPDTWFVYVD